MIGSTAHIIESKNPTLVGLNGRVIDESKNMATLATARGTRCVPKNICTWLISGSMIPGAALRRRYHERIP